MNSTNLILAPNPPFAVMQCYRSAFHYKSITMELNELRVGNFLNDREGRLCKVEAIELKENRFSAPAIQGGTTSLPNEPIPLTEEWLKKFGFERKYSSDPSNVWGGYTKNYEQKNSFKIEPEYNGYKYFFSCGSDTLTFKPIFFVHELQNLYFALTGEELQFVKAGR